MKSIFEIQHLTCEYIKDRPILYIDDLVIPRGKLIFVIGKSGIGKSTLLETLGLMNNTIAESSETSIVFNDIKNDKSEELKNSWEIDDSTLSEFRKRHFSFIFQNTNLMPNFSSGENMMMSLLIKGKDLKSAKEDVLNVMSKLDLPDDIFDKKITELSGGQRQRLAFVRAVTSEFTVLFGDEPTGNLDDATASELMRILKEIIIEENKTGIIVSHDLRLALNFADMIIPLTANKLANSDTIDEPLGVLLSDDIIVKEGANWKNNEGDIILSPIAHLERYLKSNSTTI